MNARIGPFAMGADHLQWARTYLEGTYFQKKALSIIPY